MGIRLLHLLTLIFIVLFNLNVSAQRAKSTWLTTNLGLNNCWILNQNAYGNTELDYGTKFGLNLSIGANYFIDKDYGISTGIAFGNLGQNYRGIQGGADATRKLNLTYFQIPALVIKQLCKIDNPCWLSFGPEFLFLTSAQQTYSREEGDPLKNPDYLPEGKKDVSKWFKPADILLSLGYTKAYFMRLNDKSRLTWSVKSGIGLFDINASEYQIENIQGKYRASRNFYIGAQVGFMFNP
jgi:hypothetical protein